MIVRTVHEGLHGEGDDGLRSRWRRGGGDAPEHPRRRCLRRRGQGSGEVYIFIYIYLALTVCVDVRAFNE